jgi:disulfide bond formation protein DsbB
MNRLFDTLALYGISLVLAVAFYYQFALGELPCPLCALQRVGFLVAGVALMLNLRCGQTSASYGLVLLTAVAAASASLRQIALHVVPGTGSYGSALFGFHFYTWAFVGYAALIVYVGAMLLIGVRADGSAGARRLNTAEAGACTLLIALAAVNVVAFFLECGLGPCPDDPTGYLWLPGSR